MRKTAPALIVTALFAIASTSAMAMGDRAKKKATTEPAVSSQPATPATAPAPQIDPRCDESKYTSRSSMPKECFDKEAKAAPANQSGSSSSAAGAASSGSGSAAGAGSSGSAASSSGDSK